jgi:pyocin large subunit-like protein
MRLLFLAGAAGALALTLSGCNGHPSATSGASTAQGGGQTSQASYDAARAPVPQVNGKPMWAANRKHSAEENAQYQFTKNGDEFGARSEADYVTKAHAFADAPPATAQTLDRTNGDRLIYDPRSNTFAVISRDGAPRTMFKPREGAAYWSQQKDREAKRDKGGSDQS